MWHDQSTWTHPFHAAKKHKKCHADIASASLTEFIIKKFLLCVRGIKWSSIVICQQQTLANIFPKNALGKHQKILKMQCGLTFYEIFSVVGWHTFITFTD